jgi:hypothetical protein
MVVPESLLRVGLLVGMFGCEASLSGRPLDAAFAPDGTLASDGARPVPTDSMSPADSSAAIRADAMPPPTQVGDCAALDAPGVFRNITPPEVWAGIQGGVSEPGAFTLALDPVHQGVLYLGTRKQKLWKSTDCGANWVSVATGRNGDVVNSGMNWTLEVDPIAPDVVYTTAGYGSASGLLKSSNGGVDWDFVWPPPGQPELANVVTNNFVNVVEIDPYDHQHLLLSFHAPCQSPHTSACLAESYDGGSRWQILDLRPDFNGSEGQIIHFLSSSHELLWASSSNGYWHSQDHGQTWTAGRTLEGNGFGVAHFQGTQVLRTSSGALYAPGHDGWYWNASGTPNGWSSIPDSGPYPGGIATDGTTIWTTTCWAEGACSRARYQSTSYGGARFADMPNSPELSVAGPLSYDPGHHALYSVNMADGVWRVVVP